jgi:hypothetical protein
MPPGSMCWHTSKALSTAEFVTPKEDPTYIPRLGSNSRMVDIRMRTGAPKTPVIQKKEKLFKSKKHNPS